MTSARATTVEVSERLDCAFATLTALGPPWRLTNERAVGQSLDGLARMAMSGAATRADFDSACGRYVAAIRGAGARPSEHPPTGAELAAGIER